MDVVDLLKNAPGLLEALQQTGVPQDKLSSLGGAIGDQLGGSDGFDLSVDGDMVDTLIVPDTGGWQTWITVSGTEFDMTAGEHTLRIDYIGGAINLNWLDIYPPAFEIFIEAEDYDTESGLQLEDTVDDGVGVPGAEEDRGIAPGRQPLPVTLVAGESV